MRALWIALGMAGMAEAAVFLFLLWPRTLHVPPATVVTKIEISKAGTRIYIPHKILTGKLGEYHDGLFAFLMLDHFRSLRELRGIPMLLRTDDDGGYSIWVRLPDDLVNGPFLLDQLHASHVIPQVHYEWVPPREFHADMEGTALLTEAYSSPAPDSLERLNDCELTSYLGSFIRFKSVTDYRIKHRTDPSLSPLNQEQATRLAGDMIAVSRFYDIPLSLMLGIGAMENNYMNAPGDLTHTIWKRHAERGDIVLERRRHRVLVKDDSLGVWQITRKALRRAQRLYRKDKRDYTQLPERLRPPKTLDWNHIEPEVLTTYAGLLLRDLLDHFHGDVVQAAGAYNGTVRHPNLHYAEGVQLVAKYAQRIAGNAAEVDPVTEAEQTAETETAQNDGVMNVALQSSSLSAQGILPKSVIPDHGATRLAVKYP